MEHEPSVSPVAARMAAQHGVDLTTITGTGPTGRVTKHDIERHLTAPGTAAPNAIPTHRPPILEDGALPEPEVCEDWLETMMLIRAFEQRCGEQYQKANIGGFLHLAIGEEATIVGCERALRGSDYLISTYREHGQALARGTSARAVMAELFGRITGVSHGRGGSMHLFDPSRRFMGGYGIVGGHLPIAAGLALSSDLRGTDDVTLCMFGDGASNNGTFGETLNLAALWKLPVVFVVTNNQFGMGTALERHSANTDLSQKGVGFGVEGTKCDGMDVLDTFRVISAAVERARTERRPLLVEAITYRFRGHSMADPEEYRTKEQVQQAKQRDPILLFSRTLTEAGVIDEGRVEELRARAQAVVDDATEFAASSPKPELSSLHDWVYADSPNAPDPQTGLARRTATPAVRDPFGAP